MVATHIFFYFSPRKLGKFFFKFDEYFSDGLVQPPTSHLLLILPGKSWDFPWRTLSFLTEVHSPPQNTTTWQWKKQPWIERRCISYQKNGIKWLGDGFNFLFSPQTLGKWSNSTTVVFFRWVGNKPPTRFWNPQSESLHHLLLATWWFSMRIYVSFSRRVVSSWGSLGDLEKAEDSRAHLQPLIGALERLVKAPTVEISTVGTSKTR